MSANNRPVGRIPLFGSDNDLRDWITLGRAAKLEAAGLARVVRNRKKQPVRCLMLLRKGEPRPLQARNYIGQKYHERERLNNLSPGLWPWRLKRLGRGNELRPIFLRVLTDCLVEARA